MLLYVCLHIGQNQHINFFAEKHGKTPLDGSFSHVSLYIKQKERVDKVYSIEDMKAGIEKGHENAKTARIWQRKAQGSDMKCLIFDAVTLERDDCEILELPAKKLNTQLFHVR